MCGNNFGRQKLPERKPVMADTFVRVGENIYNLSLIARAQKFVLTVSVANGDCVRVSYASGRSIELHGDEAVQMWRKLEEYLIV